MGQKQSKPKVTEVLLDPRLSADERALRLKRLLKKGASVNEVVPDGDMCALTPLHLVLLDSGLSADERLLLMERLLAAGADTNQTVTDGEARGRAPLHLVLHRSGLSADERLLLLERLLAAGAAVNQTVTDGDTWRGWAPLHLVLFSSGLSADERLLLLERLLAAGAAVNQTVTDGDTWRGHAPLHLVLHPDLSADERLLLMERLLAAGADINQTVTDGDWRGLAPLHLVLHPDLSADERLLLMERLLAAGADINQTVTDGDWRGWAPLHMVLHRSGLSADEKLLLMERLLAAGADINQTVTDGDWRGFAPLHLVLLDSGLSADERLRLMERLLAAGADINQTVTDSEWRGWAPLHLVLHRSGLSADELLLLMERLLAAGAAVNQTVTDGKAAGDTPLQIALHHNNMILVSTLIRYGASIDAIDQSDTSKLIYEGKLSLVVEEQLRGVMHQTDEPVSSENLVYSAVKMILLGDVRAGKTSIVRTLDKQIAHLTDDGEDGRTIGVEITKMQLSSQNFTVFDFGGHPSYFSTYQLFCSPRTLYLIVVDLSTFNPEDPYTQFDHWYLSTTQRAIKAVFIVVGSKLDQCKGNDTESKSIIDHMQKLESRAVASLKRELKSLTMQEENSTSSALHIQYRKDRIQLLLDNRPIIPENIVNVNVLSSECMQELATIINQTIAAHSKDLPIKKIPETWENTEQRILSMNEPYITKCKFYDISEEGNIFGDERDQFLNHEVAVGSVLHYGETFQSLDFKMPFATEHARTTKSLKLSDIVFIKPEWVMKILGCIFHHRLHKDNPDHPLLLALTPQEVDDIQCLLSEGILSKGTLGSLVEHLELELIFSLVLELLEKFSMCYEISKHAFSSRMLKTEQYFCFPGLLRRERPDIEIVWPHCCTGDINETIVIVQYNTDKSPQGFFEQISVKSNALLVDQINWKSGMVGKLNEERSSLKMELRKLNDNECILIQVRAPNDDVTRTTIMSVISTVRYTAMHYPAVVFSIHVPCHRCFNESGLIPGQTMQMWPADNFTSSDAKNVLLSCRNNHPDVHVRDIFPIRGDIEVLCDRFVIPTVRKDWLFLARELFPSINQADKAIHDIAHEHRSDNLKEKAWLVITRWQQECGQEACMNVLLSALSHMARKDILQRLNAGEQDVKDAEAYTLESAKRTDITRLQSATKRVIILTSKKLEIQQWMFLYRYMSNSQHVEAELTTIDMDHMELHEKVHAMLMKWIRDARESATFRALIEALEIETVGRGDIAEKLRDVCRQYDINLTPSGDPQRLVL